MDIARQIVANSSGLAVGLCKHMINEGWDLTKQQSFLLESRGFYHVAYEKNGDVQAGIAAFLSKQKPEWMQVTDEDFPEDPDYSKSKL